MDERVVAVGIRNRGLIITLPAPARHGDVLKPLWQMNGDIVAPDDQGFVTSTGRWVDRIEAAGIAKAAGQIETLYAPPWLFSEDVW